MAGSLPTRAPFHSRERKGGGGGGIAEGVGDASATRPGATLRRESQPQNMAALAEKHPNVRRDGDGRRQSRLSPQGLVSAPENTFRLNGLRRFQWPAVREAGAFTLAVRLGD